jgi:hypothetical protein
MLKSQTVIDLGQHDLGFESADQKRIMPSLPHAHATSLSPCCELPVSYRVPTHEPGNAGGAKTSGLPE